MAALGLLKMHVEGSEACWCGSSAGRLTHSPFVQGGGAPAKKPMLSVSHISYPITHVKRGCWQEPRDTAQWIKHLLCKNESLSSEPQRPFKIWMWWCASRLRNNILISELKQQNKWSEAIKSSRLYKGSLGKWVGRTSPGEPGEANCRRYRFSHTMPSFRFI